MTPEAPFPALDRDQLVDMLLRSGLRDGEAAAAKAAAEASDRFPMGGQSPASHYLRIYTRRLSLARMPGPLSDAVSELVAHLETLQPTAMVSLLLFGGTTVFVLPDMRQAVGCFLHHYGGIPGATDFDGHVDRLIQFLARTAKDRGRTLPHWTRIVVAARANADPVGPWEPVEVFAPRFIDVLTRTTRSWVNLTVSEIRDETLFLVVEYLTSPTGRLPIPVELISVNLSGPAVGWLDALPPG